MQFRHMVKKEYLTLNKQILFLYSIYVLRVCPTFVCSFVLNSFLSLFY